MKSLDFEKPLDDLNSKIDEIQNILGFRGSLLSDFLFQSVGLIAYLIPFTLFLYEDMIGRVAFSALYIILLSLR